MTFMKVLLSILSLLTFCSHIVASPRAISSDDSRTESPAYEVTGRDTTCNIFIYSPGADGGLHVAYLTDKEQWQDVGRLRDYGFDQTNGMGKMFNPYVCHADDGTWRLLFGTDDNADNFGAAYSEDLISWRPQDYPKIKESNAGYPVMFQMDDGTFDIYLKLADGTRRYIKADKDFRHFEESPENSSISDDAWLMDTATVAGRRYEGNQFEVPKVHLDYMMQYFQAIANERRQDAETMKEDPRWLNTLGSNISAALKIDGTKTKQISGNMTGMPLDDLCNPSKGCLYAELLDNRDMVYPIVITKGDSVFNDGYGGITAGSQEQLDFSVYLRAPKGRKGQVLVALTGNSGEIYAKEKIKVEGNDWQRYTVPLTINPNGAKNKPTASSKETDGKLHMRLMLTSLREDSISVDRMSLFPHETFKGHKMRKDIAETIAGLCPRVLTFPGIVSHNGYGPSLYDYFQFCHDTGAEPIAEFPPDAGTQDILNMIEWTKGDYVTNLRYIVIGNGANVTTDYESHFREVAKAVKDKYPEITICCASGSMPNPSPDYTEAWKFAKGNDDFGIVDEHYTVPSGWLMHHQDYYDNYNRNAKKVNINGWSSKGSTMEDALAEALYMCSLERNADVVEMAVHNINEPIDTLAPQFCAQKLWGTHSGNEYVSSTLSLSDGQNLSNALSGKDISYRLAASVVRDVAGKTYIKIVNALPAALTVNISGLQVADGTSVLGFTAQPDDKAVKPAETTVNKQRVSLPPYSVSAIEIGR